MELSKTDLKALKEGNSDYLVEKGDTYYREEKYDEAIEYYRLAACMSSSQAISNLACCYMYGKGISKNVNLALAYFQIASEDYCIDSLIKLATFYKDGIDVIQDNELAIYYIKQALDVINENEIDHLLYPNVFYIIGREKMPNGILATDIYESFKDLKESKEGYEIAIKNGETYYQENLDEVNRLLEDPIFDNIKKYYSQSYLSE